MLLMTSERCAKTRHDRVSRIYCRVEDPEGLRNLMPLKRCVYLFFASTLLRVCLRRSPDDRLEVSTWACTDGACDFTSVRRSLLALVRVLRLVFVSLAHKKAEFSSVVSVRMQLPAQSNLPLGLFMFVLIILQVSAVDLRVNVGLFDSDLYSVRSSTHSH
jgi:hypothetical protein